MVLFSGFMEYMEMEMHHPGLIPPWIVYVAICCFMSAFSVEMLSDSDVEMEKNVKNMF